MKHKKLILTIAACAILAGCAVLSIPAVRDNIVQFVETDVRHDPIDKVYWSIYLLNLAIVFSIVSALVLAVQLTKKGASLYDTAKKGIREKTASLAGVSIWKPFTGMLIFLLFAYFPLIHANVYQVPIDDLRRSLTGSRDFVGFYRYVDEYVGMLVHTSLKFVDIAPLTQFLGIAVLAAAAVALAGIFTDFRISFLALAASVPAVLSPWFLSNMTYRVDSPYMALSILVEILPFLFTANLPAYIFTSVIGNLLMCTTYQSSAGIYVVMTVALAFFRWTQGKYSGKDAWKFIGVSAACFCITLGFFKILTGYQRTGAYVNTDMLPLSAIVPGTIGNIGTYLKCLVRDLGHGMIALLFPVIAALCLFNTAKGTSRNKAATVALGVITLAFITCVSYGVYLVLELPLWNRRAFTGIGTVLAVTALMTVAGIPEAKRKKLSWTAACTVLFAYGFVAFSFMYGNAQTAQKMFTETRVNALIADLNEFCPDPAQAAFQFDGEAGWAPQTDVAFAIYPLMRENMHMNLGAPWGCLFIMKQHGYGKFSAIELEDETLSQPDLKSMNLPTLKDTGLHTIRGDGTNFYITLKPYRGK